MFPCPRCGGDADYLDDDVYPLVRCEFCGENLDAADLMLRAALDRAPLTTRLPSEKQLPLALELELV
jgi:hypothetical protein